MHIVFLGNCQVGALAKILHRFVAPYVAMTTDFVDAYQGVNEAFIERLQRAEIVVTQISPSPPRLDHKHIPANAQLHKVPLVSGAFLWPYHGVPHPLKPICRYGNPPYGMEYNDRYLAKLILTNTLPAEALAQYKSCDVAAAAHAGRLFELTLEKQRDIDAQCGYDCASIIERHLPQE